MEDHYANIAYSCDHEGNGMMDGVPIQGRPTRPGHQASMELTHPHQLRSYLIHGQIGRTIFRRPHQSLSKFIEALPPPFKNYTVPVVIPAQAPPGQVPAPRTGYYLLDEFKDIIADCISYIHYVHGKGQCTGDFTERNVVVIEGKIQFVDIQMTAKTAARVEEDYRQLSRLIVGHIFVRRAAGDVPPQDLVELMNLLDGIHQRNTPPLTAEKKAFLIENHVALMTPARCSWFLNRLFEGKLWCDDENTNGYNIALENTYLRAGWKSQINDGCPLKKVLDFKGAHYVDRCTVSHIYKYDLVRLFRNAGEHLKSQRYLTTPPLQDSDRSRMVMTVFPQFIPDLQYHLADQGVLTTIMKK